MKQYIYKILKIQNKLQMTADHLHIQLSNNQFHQQLEYKMIFNYRIL